MSWWPVSTWTEVGGTVISSLYCPHTRKQSRVELSGGSELALSLVQLAHPDSLVQTRSWGRTGSAS